MASTYPLAISLLPSAGECSPYVRFVGNIYMWVEASSAQEHHISRDRTKCWHKEGGLSFGSAIGNSFAQLVYWVSWLVFGFLKSCVLPLLSITTLDCRSFCVLSTLTTSLRGHRRCAPVKSALTDARVPSYTVMVETLCTFIGQHLHQTNIRPH